MQVPPGTQPPILGLSASVLVPVISVPVSGHVIIYCKGFHVLHLRLTVYNLGAALWLIWLEYEL